MSNCPDLEGNKSLAGMNKCIKNVNGEKVLKANLRFKTTFRQIL